MLVSISLKLRSQTSYFPLPSVLILAKLNSCPDTMVFIYFLILIYFTLDISGRNCVDWVNNMWMNLFWFQLFFSMYPDRDNPWRMLAVSSTDSFCILDVIVDAHVILCYVLKVEAKRQAAKGQQTFNQQGDGSDMMQVCFTLRACTYRRRKKHFDRFFKMCLIYNGLHLPLIRVNAAGEDKREVKGSGSNPGE